MINPKINQIGIAGLLVAAMLLMQIHSIEFWTTYAGATGILWSLLLEGAALWLWSARSIGKNGLALVASLLVLAGPLYQVSLPVIDSYRASESGVISNTQTANVLRDEITSLQAALATYNDNSKTRVGWAARIDETQARLTTVQTELKQLLIAQAAPPAMAWQHTAVISMQAIALVIFQLVIVLAIRSLSHNPEQPTLQSPRRKHKPKTTKQWAGLSLVR